MEQTSVWQQDTIGLQTLANQGKLFFQTFPGEGHLKFTLTDLENYILPFLYQTGFSTG